MNRIDYTFDIVSGSRVMEDLANIKKEHNLLLFRRVSKKREFPCDSKCKNRPKSSDLLEVIYRIDRTGKKIVIRARHVYTRISLIPNCVATVSDFYRAESKEPNLLFNLFNKTRVFLLLAAIGVGIVYLSRK